MTGDLSTDLGYVTTGTDHFLRVLGDLDDAAFAGPSILPGWTRGHVVAHVGYNALALGRLVHWAATGERTPMYPSMDARNAEIDAGATRPPAELRELVTSTAQQLATGWQELPEQAWDRPVETARQGVVPVRETLRMRAREVWLHAVDLDADADFADCPADYLDVLLQSAVGVWRSAGAGAGLALVPTDRPDPIVVGPAVDTRITGTAADLARWATGRGDRGVTATVGILPAAPPWL